MTKEGRDAKGPAQRRNDLSRTVQFYALLIGVVGCANLWIYWAGGSKLSLALGIFAFVCLAGWLVYAKRVLRESDPG
jgi:hypothetical protein